jgi:hypothetical protein
MIRALVGIFVVPFLVFQMAGGLRILWPAVVVFATVGFAAGYFIRSFM